MLREVVLHGTGYAASKLKHPLGGKTGTTNDFTDAWFVGFSPSLTCGVWVGFDEKKTLGNKETGAAAALPIWMDFMRVALEGRESEDFAAPPPTANNPVAQKAEQPEAARGRQRGPLMRRFFRYLVRVLVLIVVFMASALTAMRFAIHRRQTAVPKLVGMAPLHAQRLLADHGLVLERGDRFFSADVPEGRIMSQAPLPGVTVRRGWRVRVAESMGPQRMVIPNLVGGSERAAELNIRRRGLELGSIASATIPGGPTDQIVAQTPPANAVNVSAPKISVLVAAPEEPKSFVMPDLAGRSEDDAIKQIVDAGLRVSTIASQPPPAGESTATAAPPSSSRTVVRTTPAAGQRVSEGQGIGLEVTR